MQITHERNLAGFTHIGLFFASLIAASFILDTPSNIFSGLLQILLSPGTLLTDYIKIAGIGAALFNSGLLGLLSLLKLRLFRVEMCGAAIAGLITISGFALFGKNLYNSIPITLGVYLYATLKKTPHKNVSVISLFATSLGPLVSQLSFSLGLETWLGIVAGCGAGIVIGLITPPLAEAFINFHQGFNLYNVGFTAGIIGMFATGVLRMFDIEIEPVSILSGGNNLVLSIYLLVVFTALFLVGLSLNGWSFRNYRQLLCLSGRYKTDFIATCGYGITLINIAIMGFISWAYIIMIDGQLNGPSIGAIFTVMGFSAYGNHPKNTLPIFLGALIASLLNIHDPSGTVSIIATLFGSTLAPIAGYFGAPAGVLAGFVHVSMAINISYLHGGMNLYNNGFSGGFIAATLVPLFTTVFIKRRKKFDIKKNGPHDVCRSGLGTCFYQTNLKKKAPHKP